MRNPFLLLFHHRSLDVPLKFGTYNFTNTYDDDSVDCMVFVLTEHVFSWRATSQVEYIVVFWSVDLLSEVF